MISAVKASTRQKHMPLNSYVSLNKPMYEEDNDKTALLDRMPSNKVLILKMFLLGKKIFILLKMNWQAT